MGKTIELIRDKKHWDTINYIYVLDQSRNLIGVLSVKELMRNQNETLIKNIMKPDPAGIIVSPHHERAPIVAIQHNIKAVPVFKIGTREFIGVIGTDKILEILHRKHVENFLLFSGITKEHPTVDIFKARISRLVKLRLPWLIIGLIGGMIGATLVSWFEPTLEKEIATAFFIPVIVYISNAVSTQTQALLIRLLSSQKVKSLAFLNKEIVVSLALAMISALMIASFSFIWLQSVKVALAVGIAIVLSTLAAVLIAITIPSILYATKKDPALGSGPFATAIQDVVTLLIYLLIATWLI